MFGLFLHIPFLELQVPSWGGDDGAKAGVTHHVLVRCLRHHGGHPLPIGIIPPHHGGGMSRGPPPKSRVSHIFSTFFRDVPGGQGMSLEVPGGPYRSAQVRNTYVPFFYNKHVGFSIENYLTIHETGLWHVFWF